MSASAISPARRAAQFVAGAGSALFGVAALMAFQLFYLNAPKMGEQLPGIVQQGMDMLTVKTGWSFWRSIDGEGETFSSLMDAFTSAAFIQNISPFVIFAVLHSGMARKAFKAKVAAFGLGDMERSIYVFQSGCCCLYFTNVWAPLNGVVYQWADPDNMMNWLGVVVGEILVVAAVFNIDPFDLLGVRQAGHLYEYGGLFHGKQLYSGGLYSIVRHPIQFGFMLMMWAAPVVTYGRLQANILFTAYILVAVIMFEEVDLLSEFGGEYEAYQKRVPMLCPIFNLGLGAKAAAKKTQ